MEELLERTGIRIITDSIPQFFIYDAQMDVLRRVTGMKEYTSSHSIYGFCNTTENESQARGFKFLETTPDQTEQRDELFKTKEDSVADNRYMFAAIIRNNPPQRVIQSEATASTPFITK